MKVSKIFLSGAVLAFDGLVACGVIDVYKGYIDGAGWCFFGALLVSTFVGCCALDDERKEGRGRTV